MNVAKLIFWGSERGTDPPEMVMIKHDPGNTFGMFLYIFWMFLKKFFYSSNIWGSYMRVGGRCTITSLGDFEYFERKKSFQKIWKILGNVVPRNVTHRITKGIKLVNIAFFGIKMSKYWQN